jgi:hypothetical protein
VVPGGRVLRDEFLTSALLRHLSDSLDAIEVPFADDLQPVYVMQWLPNGPTADAPWVGTDPRKHAVSLCYPISVDYLPRIWPGTKHLVGVVVARIAW